MLRKQDARLHGTAAAVLCVLASVFIAMAQVSYAKAQALRMPDLPQPSMTDTVLGSTDFLLCVALTLAFVCYAVRPGKATIIAVMATAGGIMLVSMVLPREPGRSALGMFIPAMLVFTSMSVVWRAETDPNFPAKL